MRKANHIDGEKFKRIKTLNDQATQQKEAALYLAALGHIKEALKLDPNNIYTLNNGGDIYMHLHQNDAAKKCFDKVLAQDPGNNYALKKMSKLCRLPVSDKLTARNEKQQSTLLFRQQQDVRGHVHGKAFYTKANGASGVAIFRAAKPVDGQTTLLAAKSEVRTKVSVDGRLSIEHQVQAGVVQSSSQELTSFTRLRLT